MKIWLDDYVELDLGSHICWRDDAGLSDLCLRGSFGFAQFGTVILNSVVSVWTGSLRQSPALFFETVEPRSFASLDNAKAWVERQLAEQLKWERWLLTYSCFNGTNSEHPDNAHLNIYQPPPHITEIIVDGKKLSDYAGGYHYQWRDDNLFLYLSEEVLVWLQDAFDSLSIVEDIAVEFSDGVTVQTEFKQTFFDAVTYRGIYVRVEILNCSEYYNGQNQGVRRNFMTSKYNLDVYDSMDALLTNDGSKAGDMAIVRGDAALFLRMPDGEWRRLNNVGTERIISISNEAVNPKSLVDLMDRRVSVAGRKIRKID